MKRLKAMLRKLGWKRLLLLTLNIVLVLGVLAAALGLRFVSRQLTSLTAAERFQGEGELRFAQLACFLPVDQGKTEEDVRTFRQSLESKLVEQSLEAPENGRLYIDAYSGSAAVTLTSDNGSASVKALGVGGDFFYFHPLTLRGGSYIRSSDLMDDLVVLDEETAWRLYGGTDLAGMPLSINGHAFVVSGVVALEDDFATKRAYQGGGGVFLSFSALQRLAEDTAVTSYELVMPNPISGYAKGVVSDTFPVGDGDVVENSSRYALLHLLEVIRSFGERSMRTNGVLYPYWENAARLTEDYAAGLLVLCLLCSVCPLCFALVLAIRTIIRTYRLAKRKVPEKVEAAVEKHREERLEQQFKKKSGGEGSDGGFEPAQREEDL